MDADIKKDIVEKIIESILTIAPEAKMFEMYGGTMVEMVGGKIESRCCGYFVYTKHVSLEFTKGFQFNDPHNVLEGTGKLRRHIKLWNLEDVADKRCADYLRQAARF